MAKLNDSNLAGSSGKVGRLVVSNIYGYEVLKHRPARRGNKGATPKQLLVQSRMTLSGSFIQGYKELARVYYGKRRGLKSSFNQAMKNLMDHFALDYANQKISPVYQQIAVTKGDLLGVYGPQVVATDPQQVKLTWVDNSFSDVPRQDDFLQVVLSAEDSFLTYYVKDMATRKDLTATISTPPEFSGKNVHVWMAFTAPDLIMACNSVYLGEVQIL